MIKKESNKNMINSNISLSSISILSVTLGVSLVIVSKILIIENTRILIAMNQVGFILMYFSIFLCYYRLMMKLFGTELKNEIFGGRK